LTPVDAGGTPDLERSASNAVERIQRIVESAERAAGQIRASADEDAERRLEEARQSADRLTMDRVGVISQLTDSLIERAEEVRRLSDGLIVALDAAIADVEAASEGAAGAPAEPADAHLRQLAVLRATLMALGESERAAIEATLRAEYGIGDPGPLVDQILGTPRP
jgi:vacuolar-type H+-ATPase subunit H